MKTISRNGATSNVLRVKILDSTSGSNAGKTGLAFNSSGLVISTIASNEASATLYSAGGGTIESIATLGTYAAPTATKCRFKEVDAANHPGLYEIQLADARYAVAGARTLIVTISGPSGACQCDLEIQLSAVDPDNATTGGIGNLDAAVSSRLATSGYAAPDNSGIASAGAAAASASTAAAAARKLLESDRVIDTAVTPWALVLIEKGTGALGSGNE